jgi:hypothetical protein
MNRTADLDTALRFVIERIEEEATRSGEPLSDEQRFLLNHLPAYSAWTQPYGGDPEIPAQPIPRDTTYERVCAVAKAAHHHDLRLNPESALDWEFAAAVHILCRSYDAARGERTLDRIPVDSRRCWIHCFRGSSVFCFAPD